jgi:predicted phage terminase large subunit-like protein
VVADPKILIEEAGSGVSLIQDLQSAGLQVYPVRPTSDKVVRMSAQRARIEEGRVLLLETTPWLDDFRSEIMAFPNGRHDDQVDSISQALASFNRPKAPKLIFV